ASKISHTNKDRNLLHSPSRLSLPLCHKIHGSLPLGHQGCRISLSFIESVGPSLSVIKIPGLPLSVTKVADISNSSQKWMGRIGVFLEDHVLWVAGNALWKALSK